MQDETKIDDDFSSVEDGKKGRGRGGVLGFIPSIIIEILKWLLIIILMIIMMVVVAVVVNRMSNSNQSGTGIFIQSSKKSAVKSPLLDWFQQLDDIRTRSNDSDPSMIIVKVDIGYTKEDQETLTELINRRPLVHDAIRFYFAQKSREELKNEETIKLELKNNLNRIMNTERIKAIAFENFDIID